MARTQRDKSVFMFEGWLNELGLCKQFKINAELILTSEAYTAALYYKKLMRRMGLKQSFRSALEALLYTGPRNPVNKTINNELKHSLIISNRGNHTKAIYFADTYGYSLLERTPMGRAIDDYQRKNLNGKIQTLSLFDVLLKEAKTFKKTPKDIRAIAQGQFDIVMGFVSAAFIFSCKGNVDTLVCGASPQKVFYMFELPALMANEKITSINNVPKDRFLKVYNSGKENAAQQTYSLICESEIARLGVLAQKKGKASKEWEIWEEQKKLFHVDTKQKQVVDVFKAILNQKIALPTIPTARPSPQPAPCI